MALTGCLTPVRLNSSFKMAAIFQTTFSNAFSLKFVPEGPINNIPSLVQIMAWCPLGEEPLSEPMMVSLLMHICIIRPQ